MKGAMSEIQCNLTLDWRALGKLPKRPKLREVAATARLLFDDFYQVSDCEYLNAANQWDDDFTEQTIYVNSFIWAPSYGAFCRTVSRKRADMAKDDGAARELPSEMRLAPDCASYGAITAYLSANDSLRSSQHDLYDENSVPIGSYLRVEGWSYFFRSPLPVPPDEAPFAVDLLTNKRLLLPAGGVSVMFRERSSQQCCVLNGGGGAWAFEPLATQLSSFLGIEVSNAPRKFNYLLNFDDADRLAHERFFIPLEAILLASDKRLQSAVFSKEHVPTPTTQLFENFEEASRFVQVNSGKKWCLKYPTGCGANGHRMLHRDSRQPPNWPKPFIVQEFIQLERPEVYRIFCAGGEMFGWLARRFPDGGHTSPWVAHARGARYVRLGQAPSEAFAAAQCALTATKLWDSFGCVDMLQKPTGDWVVLEVGTDGLFNHVDRSFDDEDFLKDLNQHIARSFLAAAERALESVPHA